MFVLNKKTQTMYTTEGKIFTMRPAEEVINYIRSNEYKILKTSPRELNITEKDTKFFIQTNNDRSKMFPLRTSFLNKLLNWHNLPGDLPSKLSQDVLVSVLNELLHSIKSKTVNIKFENNEALTITSQLYSEITDLKVFELIKPLGITKISRNDFITRFYTEKKDEIDPVEGDFFGFGLNIINSETGFAALTVQHFILRYICSNGATAPIEKLYVKKDHYKQKPGELAAFLQQQIDFSDGSRKHLVSKIRLSSNVAAKSSRNFVTSKINYMLGGWQGNNLLTGYNWDSSLYDLFNFITDKAKKYDITKRYQLEKLAGEIILN